MPDPMLVQQPVAVVGMCRSTSPLEVIGRPSRAAACLKASMRALATAKSPSGVLSNAITTCPLGLKMTWLFMASSCGYNENDTTRAPVGV
jgi:hypothetical protein